MTDDVKALIASIIDDHAELHIYYDEGYVSNSDALAEKIAAALEAATVAPAVDREALVAVLTRLEVSTDADDDDVYRSRVADAVIAALGARDVRDVQAEAEKRGAEAMRERILRFADDDGLIDQNLVASITAQAIREARSER